jgi:hypothetical protein
LSAASPADFFDSCLAIFYIILVFVGPFFHIIYFTINLEKLREDETFMKKFETVFEASKIDRFANLWFNAFFMFRRLIFALTCIYLDADFRCF